MAAVDRLWRDFFLPRSSISQRKPVSKWLTFPVAITYCQDQSPRNKNLKIPPIKLTFNNPAIMTVVLLGLLVFNVMFRVWQVPNWLTKAYLTIELFWNTTYNQLKWKQGSVIQKFSETITTHSQFFPVAQQPSNPDDTVVLTSKFSWVCWKKSIKQSASKNKIAIIKKTMCIYFQL